MKVTNITVFPVETWCTLVKVETDEGLVGWGEVLSRLMNLAVIGAVEDVKGYLVGKDPRNIEHHWQALYRGTFMRGGQVWVSAVSGVEIAMWDILGKSLGVPVFKLLGGKVRDRVRMYAHFGGATPEQCAQSAKTVITQRNVTALKFGPFRGPTRMMDSPIVIKETADKMQAAREAVGDSVDIAIDCHGRFSPAMACLMAEAVAPYRPFFFEEPILPDNVDSLAQVARSTTVPIATGERICTTFGFREILEKRAASILQPDAILCGGIFQLHKIAAMAETYYVALAPHNFFGPIDTAAALHFAACTPNFLILEHRTLGEGILKEPFVIKNGYIDIPQKPGLGVEVDEEHLPTARKEPGYLSQLALHEDGSWGDV